MLRTDNPANKLLSNSLCYFKVKNSFLKSSYTNYLLYHSLQKNNGDIKINSGSEILLTIPHSSSDAFGGLYTVNKLLEPNTSTNLSNRLQDEGSISYQNSDYHYYSWTIQKSKRAEAIQKDKTFLQMFIATLLGFKELSSFERIALPICLDDLKDLNEENIWGNSFVIVTFTQNDLFKLVDVDKPTWRNTLHLKALRVLELLKRRPHENSLKNTLLISSLGNIDQFSWANNVDPRSITMIPTPSCLSSANIVLWATKETQTLSICGSKDHQLIFQRQSIEKAWSGVIHEFK